MNYIKSEAIMKVVKSLRQESRDIIKDQRTLVAKNEYQVDKAMILSEVADILSSILLENGRP